ncbi:MAG TPA: hypothetical protein VGI00_04590 [Streptosporangiaceae bacterium]
MDPLAAAATRAWNSRGSSPSSGCHCTPTMKTGLPATSRPSTVPSAAQAVATSPSPSWSTAWWWCVGASSQV